MQKLLQRLEHFSQVLLSPLSYLSAAGLLLVAGALLTSKPLCQVLPVLQWGPLHLAGQLLYNGMMALINNLSVILCVGVAAVQARAEKQEAALLALMAYLIFLTTNHTALEAPAGRARLHDRPCRDRPDHHSGHPGAGYRRGRGHPAGLCGGLALQPHL